MRSPRAWRWRTRQRIEASAFEVLPLREESVRAVRPALYVMVAAVASLLVIASLNLAGLLGARAADRAREFALRRALGASRGRLLLQALAEVAPVLAIGGLAGVAAARMAIAAFISLAPAALPRVDSIAVDGPGTGILAGCPGPDRYRGRPVAGHARVARDDPGDDDGEPVCDAHPRSPEGAARPGRRATRAFASAAGGRDCARADGRRPDGSRSGFSPGERPQSPHGDSPDEIPER